MLIMPRKQRLTRKGDKSVKARVTAAVTTSGRPQQRAGPAEAAAALVPDPAAAAEAAAAAAAARVRARALADYSNTLRLRNKQGRKLD